MNVNEVPILLRRRLEAMLLAHVYEELKSRMSDEDAQEIIGAAVSRSAIEQGKMMAEDLGHAPSLTDFHEIMPLWQKDDALKIEEIEASEEKLDFNVVRCRYSEMYKEMGLGHIGHLLSCNRDGDFCVGYNPDMEMTRTQTIMKGASHCDFRYRMKSDEEA